MRQLTSRWGRTCFKGMAAIALVTLLLPAGLAQAQVGQTRQEFEQVSGKPIDTYKTDDGTQGLVYHDVWYSEKTRKQFTGRTAIELSPDNRVVKEVFYFDQPLSNNQSGAVDAVGIALNLLPSDTPTQFVNSGRRPYKNGWVLWFDYGQGRYINFFLNKAETEIDAVVGGVQATNL
ncbi:MAG TPA: hypothetical protein V6D47_09685 [Oscillatoriaceae cyanobacterium]